MDDGDALAELRNVAFAYDAARPVLAGVDWSLQRKERCALLGTNGSGKTTLLHLLVGLLKPTSGEVFVLNQPRRTEKDFAEVRQRVGLVFQNPDDQLFCPTVAEDVAFGPINLGWESQEVRQTVSETLDALGLNGYEKRVTYQLSFGEQRLVSLATVIAMKPDLLLLDEPTANLDARTTETLLRFLREQWRGGVLLVSHNAEHVRRVCGRAAVLSRGRMAAVGSTDEVMEDAVLLRSAGLEGLAV
jgi:cobalt/nickel transport system ATP-binding protein